MGKKNKSFSIVVNSYNLGNITRNWSFITQATSNTVMGPCTHSNPMHLKGEHVNSPQKTQRLHGNQTKDFLL